MKLKRFLSESKWCKFAEAIDSHGRVTHARDKDAQKWCLSGAIYRCYRHNPKRMISVVKSVNRWLWTFHQYDNMYSWNDDDKRTWDDISELIHILNI